MGKGKRKEVKEIRVALSIKKKAQRSISEASSELSEGALYQLSDTI